MYRAINKIILLTFIFKVFYYLSWEIFVLQSVLRLGILVYENWILSKATMDRRKKGKKKNKSFSSRPHDQATHEQEKRCEIPQGLDTSGLSEQIAPKFKEADILIQAQYARIAKQQNLLLAAKDKAFTEIDGCFDKLQQIMNRRKQLLKSEVKDTYEHCLEDILQKKENVIFSGMMLETLLKQAKDISQAPNSESMAGFEDMVLREIEKHCSSALNEAPSKNFIEFDKTSEALENTERRLRAMGRIRTDHILPSIVNVEDCKAIIGLQSQVVLDILDIKGNSVPASFIESNLVSFQLKDSTGEFIHHRIFTSEDNKVTIQFHPLSGRNHRLEVLFLSCALKELEILIDENIPVQVLGAEAGLAQPSALCTISEERLCVADGGDSKLLLFSSSGVLQAETFFPDGNFIPFDVTYAPTSDMIICTGSYTDDQEDTLSASPDGIEASFPLDSQEDSVQNSEREVQNRAGASAGIECISRINNNKDDSTEACALNDECLKLFETTILNVKVLCIEKRGYVTMNQHNMIILSDPNSNCVSVYTIDGQFLRVVYAPELDCPGAVVCKSRSDDRIIVTDIGKSVIWTGSMEKGLKERWGSVETELKQLCLPITVAVDEEGNLLVADGAGPRVFIYGEWGEFVSLVELSPPAPSAKCNEQKQKALVVSPWALTILNSTIWLIDNNSHQILRYRYSLPL